MASKSNAFTQMRTTVIKRGQQLRFDEVSRPFVTSQGAAVLSDGIVPHLYHSAVENVLHLKSKESGVMQGLNERLASYIENVRFLEAQNKELLALNDSLKKTKEYDSSELKDLYEKELAECRKVIDGLSDEKVSSDAKLVSLEEKLDTAKNERDDFEKQNGDLKHRIDRLNSHVGDYDGELTNLRMKVEFLESEIDKLKDTNKRLRDDNGRLQGDLDVETINRLTTDNELQAVREHYQFQLKVQDTEIVELRAVIDSEKAVDMSGIWKGELSKAVTEIQTEYDKQLEDIRQEVEQKMNLQLQKIQSNVSRDSIKTKQAWDENKLLRSRLEIMRSKMADMETEIATQKVNIQTAYEEKTRVEQDHGAEVRRLHDTIRDYEKRIEAIVEELNILQNAKLSLEVEIMMYRKLLECEEKKFSPTRSFDDKPPVEIKERTGEYELLLGNVKIMKACRDHVSVSEASLDGTFVTIENTGKMNQDLKGWKISRENEKGRITNEYTFGDVTLEAGKHLKVFAASGHDAITDKDLTGHFHTWGAGSGQYKLYDRTSQEAVASLCLEFTMDKQRSAKNE